MAITDFAKAYREKIFPEYESELLKTDPEFMERFYNFAFDKVIHQGELDERIRFMAILAALLGCQGAEEIREMLPAVMNVGMTPVELKEIVYQAVAYLGIGKVFPFFRITNEVLTEKGMKLPLEGQAATTMESRREAGTQAQVDIFGDYYTRTGLDCKQRESEIS